MSIVLQKFIADSGHCSRREAERLIRDGKVKLNGRTAELGSRAESYDNVSIGKKRIFTKREDLYVVMNKPEGYVCSNRRFDNEKCIFDLIALNDRLFTVGRLDKESHGLVFMTNDGDLSQRLTHPSFGHEKEYEISVKCEKFDEEEIMKNFKSGVDIGSGDGYVRCKNTEYLGNNRFRMILTEGKKRQIRRMFETQECKVVDLIRTRIGSVESGLRLGKLMPGEWRFLNKKETADLLREGESKPKGTRRK